MKHDPLRYDDIAEQLYAPIYPVIAKKIVERTEKRGGRMLDAGCGGGHLGYALLELAPFSSVTLLDENEQALAVAARRAEERGLADRVEATYTGDVCALDLGSVGGKPFDLIVSRGSMPFWENQHAAFTNLYGLLAPGGAGYVGGGMGSTELASSISAHMAEIRRQNSGEGPRLFDRSQSKALGSEVYRALFAELGAACEIIESEDEGRWILFRKPKV